jgi:hypothetical protein
MEAIPSRLLGPGHCYAEVGVLVLLCMVIIEIVMFYSEKKFTLHIQTLNCILYSTYAHFFNEKTLPLFPFCWLLLTKIFRLR